MTSPYINTRLDTLILLQPHQMDNKLYLHLKRNLEEEILNKCFKNYGYIMNIYNIISYDNGIFEAENLSASAIFKITFACRLCRPLVHKQIICKINRVNKMLITAINGPIMVIITGDRVNNKIFFTDNNNELRYKKNGSSLKLQPDDIVKLTVASVTFNNKDTKIKIIGVLDDMATNDEINNYASDLINIDKDEVNINEYISQELINKYT